MSTSPVSIRERCRAGIVGLFRDDSWHQGLVLMNDGACCVAPESPLPIPQPRDGADPSE